MSTKIMKTVGWRFSRAALTACALIVVSALLGLGYETLATSRYRSRGMPGKLVDVGGYREYIHCLGTGQPTIVLDSGLGDASDVWRGIQGQVAEYSRTCVFDRPGLGWSDDGPDPRSSGMAATELHTLLDRSGEKGPYLLVAHSMAGYDTRIFASKYAGVVSGVLLLDVAHPDQNERESAYALRDRGDFMTKQAWWGRLGPFGITRLLGHCEWSPQDCTRSYWTTLKEFDAFNKISPGQVREAGNLGSIPLIVISHDPNLEMARDPSEHTRKDEVLDAQLQEELAQLSTKGCLMVAVGSGHYIQDDRSDLVLSSIKKLVEASRSPDEATGLCK
jgi:pimeloyl-ACP methyl ester carboxylesterase